MAQLKICSTNGMRGERSEWGARGRECRLVKFCGRRAEAVTKGGSSHDLRIDAKFMAAHLLPSRAKKCKWSCRPTNEGVARHDSRQGEAMLCAQMSRWADEQTQERFRISFRMQNPQKRHSVKCKFLVCCHYGRLMCEGSLNTSCEVEKELKLKIKFYFKKGTEMLYQ